MEKCKAIVLSGGGARGAYQVGVLTAVAEVAHRLKLKNPFKIFTGISAGSINAVYLAAGAQDFVRSVNELAKMWSQLHSEQVFRSDVLSLGKISLTWMGELSFGGVIGSTPGRALLDTAPLGDLVRDNVNFSSIQQNIQDGNLRALAVTALDYSSSMAITFVQGHEDCKLWVRARRRAEKSQISADHILASSAIPLLFSPVQVGNRFFGDGCVRNQSPLSPALHLGASDLLVIGVRRQDAGDGAVEGKPRSPSVARVINVLLNSVLLDGIEVDMERLARINEFLKRVPQEHQKNLNFKTVEAVWVYPSQDIGELAGSMSSRLPRLIRYLLKGLGPLEEAHEIISYLLFEPEFCSRLIDFGYQDGKAQEEAIEKFLLS